MKNLDSAQSAIKKNYASVINRIRPLAKDSRRVSQSVRPGPGLKPQAPSSKLQAPSLKLQANQKPWNKIHNLRCKPQASSPKQQALLYFFPHKVLEAWNRHQKLG